MNTVEFSFEFYNEVSHLEHLEGELRAEAESRLRELAADHTDMIGASVAIEELTGDMTPHRYQVRVVAYMRPDNVAAVEKGETIEAALNGALAAVERQVREYRNKLREQWKPP